MISSILGLRQGALRASSKRTGISQRALSSLLGQETGLASISSWPTANRPHRPWRGARQTPFRSGIIQRNVWSTGTTPPLGGDLHPLISLTPDEISAAASVVKAHYSDAAEEIRFVAIALNEPNKAALRGGDKPPRQAEIIVINTTTGIASELTVSLVDATVISVKELERGVQPLLTPDDCDLAEAISKSSPELQAVLKERYGITDMSRVAADPWSVHLASEEDVAMTEPDDPSLPPRRLVQTFLYQRVDGDGIEDNHYAHPIVILPVVDLNSKTVIKIDGLDRPATKIPQASVNYHRDLLNTNSYLQTQWRADTLKALDITQPDGPSFTVTDNLVEWQGWKFRVGWNYREGIVLHQVHFNDRPVVNRLSLVEMAVPYADPFPPFPRKCAFDVGDYGLGFCANSLELGCDCLGHIHYFDAALNDSKGDPYVVKKAICMHEEDQGILFKHVEYRNGHSESRRARELVISKICTVVNYEYLMYIRFKLNGEIEFELRLSGELSTNQPSAGEDPNDPSHGVLCAPGVNAQVHQHMFCARIDMAVDGDKNTVSEIDVVPHTPGMEGNPYGNVFGPVETVLKTEAEAVRLYDANKARVWKVSNAEGKVNGITKKPTAYKLVPFTKGPAQPPLLTAPDSAVSKKGEFATAHLWVTPYDETERYPAGEYTPQAKEQAGLPVWIKDNESIEGEDVVLWHAFGVTHVPRVEDFPIMNCEMTGFSLKPDGFNSGNPAIDLPPETNTKSKLDSGCCASSS
ncbi:Copper amine oxidase 1 [Seminavis robusta]|uniref:Amine oxidase n=1 Tax=Seminavis robusta TaxID=568900 RepID=A0A9N8DBG2_9STRA|nr:Copper amine oxidase 1 [Seminavis robusta]|eukprot:Sro65_g036800.1 Copper amine oxidase 1 (749) ;mRNA; r:80971-83409